MFTIANCAITDFNIVPAPATGVTVNATTGLVTVAAGTAAATIVVTATGKAGGAAAGLTANKSFKIV